MASHPRAARSLELLRFEADGRAAAASGLNEGLDFSNPSGKEQQVQAAAYLMGLIRGRRETAPRAVDTGLEDYEALRSLMSGLRDPPDLSELRRTVYIPRSDVMTGNRLSPE